MAGWITDDGHCDMSDMADASRRHEHGHHSHEHGMSSGKGFDSTTRTASTAKPSTRMMCCPMEPDFPPRPPQEDDDEAATVVSFGAQYRGLLPVVIPQWSSQPAGWQQITRRAVNLSNACEMPFQRRNGS